MRDALQLIQQGLSIRQAAKVKGLLFQSVHRYLKKYKQNPNNRLRPNYKIKQIFTNEQEYEFFVNTL